MQTMVMRKDFNEVEAKFMKKKKKIDQFKDQIKVTISFYK